MEDADVGKRSGVRKGDPETSEEQRGLGQAYSLLGRSKDKSGMYAIGRRVYYGVKGAVRIDRDVG